MSVPPLVDPRDFGVGRIVISGRTDTRVVELWAEIASHRSGSEPERLAAVSRMKKRLRSLTEERSRHLHGLYVPSGDHDPVDDAELRTFERGQARLKADGITVNPANLQAMIRAFARDCRKAKGEFGNSFAITTRS